MFERRLLTLTIGTSLDRSVYSEELAMGRMILSIIHNNIIIITIKIYDMGETYENFFSSPPRLVPKSRPSA